VESLYETDATSADRMLDDLIVYLRAALPQLRETASTVAREIELARAYLNVAQARKGDRLSLKVVMARDASDVRFPPMVLLPLIEHSIVHRVQPLKAGDAIGVGTRIENGKLCLTVTDSGARSLHQNPGNAALQGIRERLAALYGASASLSLDPDVDHGLSAVIKIPHERIDDRHHR
jgi:LytS/YehU family sensor histidine kinase